MMHLIVKAAATVTTRMPTLLATVVRYAWVPSSSVTTVDSVPTSSDSIFRSRVTNFLDLTRAVFHYSVIGEFATVLRASGYVGGHPLNDDV